MFTRKTLLVRIALLFCLSLIAPVSVTHGRAAGTPSFPLRLSADGKYLVDWGNRPFFTNGDTAWSLIAQLSQVNADIYLADRAQRGFNLVLVNLIGHQFATNAPANRRSNAVYLTW